MPPRKAQASRRKPRKKPVQRFTLPKISMPAINWSMLVNGVLLTGLCAGVYQATLWAMDQPIESVRIESRFQRVSTPQVEAALDAYVKQGFLTISLAQVQASLEKLPWVAEASVHRRWPSSLSVRIIEQRAAARWGERGLLNVYGELFVENATHVPSELPRLSGPAGTEAQVAQRFFELNSALQQRGKSAVSLTLDARGSWDMVTSSGVKVRLGAEDFANRSARFFAALDSVLEPLTENIAYIDLRYTNGFAVGWKSVDRVLLTDNREAASSGG